ncbi:hypothetical protein A6U95_28500 [Serratia sp. 14-2641]|nr:hypothetical protein A6U95_28500 [Serratia sp. 14-2641]
MVLSPSFASDQKEKNGSNFLTIKLMSVQNRSGQINVREQAQVRETVDRFLHWEKTVKPRGVYREDLGGVLPTLISSEFLCLLEMASDVRESAPQEDPDLKPPFVEGSLFMPNAWGSVKDSTIISSQHILSIKAMCRVLRVARSGWYAWRLHRHQITPRQQFRLVCDDAVRKTFNGAKQRYGAPRLADELPAYNVQTIAASLRR